MDKKVIVILGPTATHKSDFAIKLAEEFPLEIISADSMQFYKGMDIGTAKIPKELRKKIPHHMIDIIDISEEYSIADYKKQCIEVFNGIYERNHIPILVGGSGLYIRTITENFPVEKGIKDDLLREELSKLSTDELRMLATECDPVRTQIIGKNDRKRLIRIIEYYREAKRPMSQIQNPLPPFKFLKIGLIKERNKLYEDIDKRVDRMIELGLVEEVKKLKAEYNKWSKTASQAIGYKEIIAYLDGKISLDEAIRLIKQHTRNLAKRQITWFKKERDVTWIDVEDFDKAYTEVKRLVGEFLNEN